MGGFVVQLGVAVPDGTVQFVDGAQCFKNHVVFGHALPGKEGGRALVPGLGVDTILSFGGGGGGGGGNGSSNTSKPPDFPTITAYEKNGVSITLDCFNTGSSGVTKIVATTTNNSGGAISNYGFQAAVLAKMTVELSPPSGTSIAPGSCVTQEMVLTNTLVGTVSVLLSCLLRGIFFNLF